MNPVTRSVRRAFTPVFSALAILSILGLPVQAETSCPERFIQAVQAFADVALEHGRDTYGPKQTPLFVDGINIETHEPVMWKSRDGHPWVLSDLGNQQNFFARWSASQRSPASRVTSRPQSRPHDMP